MPINFKKCIYCLFYVVAMAVTSALASQAQPSTTDPVLEARVQDLSHKLRCLVCQNQSIADSDADLAQDLRSQVREQLSAGKNEAQIISFMVERYGDFVLYEPPVKKTTLILWVAPVLLMLGGLFGLWYRLKCRVIKEIKPLSNEERMQAQALLSTDTKAIEPEIKSS